MNAPVNAEVARVRSGHVPRDVVRGARVDVEGVRTSTCHRHRRERRKGRGITRVHAETKAPIVVMGVVGVRNAGTARVRLVVELERSRLSGWLDLVPVRPVGGLPSMRRLARFGCGEVGRAPERRERVEL